MLCWCRACGRGTLPSTSLRPQVDVIVRIDNNSRTPSLEAVRYDATRATVTTCAAAWGAQEHVMQAQVPFQGTLDKRHLTGTLCGCASLEHIRHRTRPVHTQLSGHVEHVRAWRRGHRLLRHHRLQS